MSQKIKQDISIGSNIRELRIRAGLTQKQVIARLQVEGVDISRSSYSQIECGTYSIRISELRGLARLYHVDYNAFFEGI